MLPPNQRRVKSNRDTLALEIRGKRLSTTTVMSVTPGQMCSAADTGAQETGQQAAKGSE